MYLFLPAVDCGGGGPATQSTPPGESGPPASWIAFVKNQARPLQSIDPDNTNFSDLTFLGPVLQGRTIVELGESGHGVAQFSQAKIRLIKYLHEQLRYDVIAFESSILSTYLANAQANQLTPTAFMQDSIFAVWSTTDVVKLFSYIQSTQNTAHPLILAGFDVQLTTLHEIQVRPGVFQQVVAQVDPVYAQQVYDLDQTFVQNFNQSSYILANHSDLKTKYQALTAFLDANMTQIEQAYPTTPIFPLVVRQAAWGMSAFLDELNDNASNDQIASSNARDAGMATNLEILVENLYPGTKVMVWAHNSHIAHDALSVAEWGWQNMGSYIFQKYGGAVYTFGVYMYQGSADFNNRTTYTIPAAPDNSTEGLLHTVGDPYVFLDISNVTNSISGTAWLFQDYAIRDWGIYDSSMILKNEYDGLLQIETVNPPMYIN
jgi:erythromycin esterase